MSQYDDELRALLKEGRRLKQVAVAAAEDDRYDERDWDPDRDGERRDRPRESELAGLRGRPTRTLQTMWIDPAETPFTPVTRPGKAIPARLFAFLVLASVLGMLAWLIVPEVNWRINNADRLIIRDGVLTAQPVPLAPPVASIVDQLYVDAGHLPNGVLPAGTPIARLRTGGQFADPAYVNLTAPFDARFVSVDTLEGAVTQPGTPVATVFDPRKMYVVITVRPAQLERLRRGMRARLTSAVLDEPIDGTVVAAVPLLGTDQNPTTSTLVNVRIQPDGDSVRDLVPGLRFDASIDLDSAPDGAQPLVITGVDEVTPSTGATGSDGSGVPATSAATAGAFQPSGTDPAQQPPLAPTDTDPVTGATVAPPVTTGSLPEEQVSDGSTPTGSSPPAGDGATPVTDGTGAAVEPDGG